MVLLAGVLPSVEDVAVLDEDEVLVEAVELAPLELCAADSSELSIP